MSRFKKDYALITGGSEGIGKAFAEECALKGMNLVIAALPGPSLKKSAEYFEKKYGVAVQTIGIDLTEKEAPRRLFDFCREKGITVRLLINNAGLAGSAVFEKSSLEDIDNRIQLNIRALVFLTRLFIPVMKELDSAFILNIGGP